MAKTQSLKAEPRQRTGSGVLKQMRREGYVPSVVYGGSTENINVKVKAKEFKDLLAQSASDNILVTLDIEEGASQLAFLKALQHDPLTGQVLHIDFLAVGETTEITGNIPINMIGDSIGVEQGGVLEQQLHSIEIKCLPKDLPDTLEADISHLDVGDALHVGQVTWPDGVTPTLGQDVVLAVVARARVEEEEVVETEEGAELAEGEEAPAEGAEGASTEES